MSHCVKTCARALSFLYVFAGRPVHTIYTSPATFDSEFVLTTFLDSPLSQRMLHHRLRRPRCYSRLHSRSYLLQVKAFIWVSKLIPLLFITSASLTCFRRFFELFDVGMGFCISRVSTTGTVCSTQSAQRVVCCLAVCCPYH